MHPDADALRTLAVIAAFAHQMIRQRALQISGTLATAGRVTAKDWIVALADAEETVTIETGSAESAVVFADGSRFAISSDWLPGKRLASFTIGDRVAEVKIDLIGSAIRLRWRGMDVRARVRSPRVAQLARLMPVKVPPDMSRMLLCPMPGVITSVTVGVGDQVEAGQTLATVEAMKMENVLKAERRGVVKRVTAVPGQSLAVDELIMEFE